MNDFLIYNCVILIKLNDIIHIISLQSNQNMLYSNILHQKQELTRIFIFFIYFNLILLVYGLFILGKDQDAITQYQSQIMVMGGASIRWLNMLFLLSVVLWIKANGSWQRAVYIFIYSTRIYLCSNCWILRMTFRAAPGLGYDELSVYPNMI